MCTGGVWEWGHDILKRKTVERKKESPGVEVRRSTDDCMVLITGMVKTDIMYDTATAKRVLRHRRMKRRSRGRGGHFAYDELIKGGAVEDNGVVKFSCVSRGTATLKGDIVLPEDFFASGELEVLGVDNPQRNGVDIDEDHENK